MELRRYKDILALKTRDNRFVGFHAYNLEIAELTSDIWQKMAPIDVRTSVIPEIATDEELDTWNNEINSDTKDLVDQKSIRFFSINIAQICNLKCTYCAAGGDGTYGSDKAKVDLETTFKQLKWLLEKVPAGDIFEVRFLGGEPLLYPAAIREIANYARLLVAGKNIKIGFYITTNGTLINASAANLLADLNAHVTISLDGDKEVNDKVRPAKGGRSSTQMTEAGIKELLKVRESLGALQVNSVFGAHNLDCVSTYNYLVSLADWDSISLNYSINEQDGELSPAYVEQMAEIAELAYERTGLKGLAQIAQFRESMSRVEAQTRNLSHCAAGRSMIQSDTRGELYVCNWFMTDKAEQVGQGTALETQKISAFNKSLIELNDCGKCWARHFCGGGCMAVNRAKNGDKHSKEINFCSRQRGLAAIALEYYFNSLTGGTNEKH